MKTWGGTCPPVPTGMCRVVKYNEYKHKTLYYSGQSDHTPRCSYRLVYLGSNTLEFSATDLHIVCTVDVQSCKSTVSINSVITPKLYLKMLVEPRFQCFLTVLLQSTIAIYERTKFQL